tara:strand:+ start:130 stop:315 length:186 start_codon:yes stop_codon:yes gene_type:complete
MKIGDMLLNDLGYTAILLTEPRLEDDPDFGDPYYVADVLLTEFDCKDVWITDDVEIINEDW